MSVKSLSYLAKLKSPANEKKKLVIKLHNFMNRSFSFQNVLLQNYEYFNSALHIPLKVELF